MLRLHDTATGDLEELVLRDPGKVGLYVCGSTVYASPHIGHGRFSLVYDVLRRYLEHTGLEVRHVSNVTDVDDKIIARSKEEGRPAGEIAAQFEAEWWDAMDLLGCLRPRVAPHATAYVDEMVELIERLVTSNSAYETSDGVYFSVATVPDYGLLARQNLESLRAGARVEPNDEKRSPVDFALWKKAKPGEPTWPSPFGDGRPGWHTECVVMALACLGEDFDVHGGGQDLMFPHHENERAQALADGKAFSRRWIHHGMVEAGGVKMSKSLGNVTSLTDLVEEFDPRAYRLLVLQAHYRAPIEIGSGTLADATAALGRLDALSRRLGEAAASANGGGAEPGPGERGASSGVGLAGAGGSSSVKGGSGEGASAVRAHFSAAMEADLDSPAAMAALFDGLRQANSDLDARDLASGLGTGRAVLDCFGAVGIFPREAEQVPEAVLELSRKREQARAAREFDEADRHRDEIARLGYAVEDGPAGPRIHRR